jgi:two-component system, OmpR family, heavy metal sensor histidine kinase CusS
VTRFSIGLRLTLWYLAIFALGQFAFGAGMWLVLRHHLVSIVDHNLRDQTEDLRSFLESQKKNADLAKFQEEVTETYSQEHAGEYLALSTSNGDPVYISDFLKKNAFAAPAHGMVAPDSLGDRVIGTKALRFYRVSVNTHGFTFVSEMGTPMKEVWSTLQTFRNYLLLLAPLVLLTSAVGGYWLSRRALAPVDALTRTARNISGQNLSNRLEKLHTGDELQRLADTLNEMLERIEKAFLQVTQFTADASHELRTPISLMRTEAEIALRKARDADAYREALQHILKETEKTSILIEDLLALARADSGREFLKPQPVELGELLRDCMKEWKPVAVQAGLELNVHSCEDGPVWVMADESALRRALTILLDNAVKYTPAPGHIDVFWEKCDGRAVVSVSDSGIGIPASEQSKIFERFYRVDKARGRAAGGTGLGLPIARWIVERHGGSITVETTTNKGSRFSVQVPAVSHAVLMPQTGHVEAGKDRQ